MSRERKEDALEYCHPLKEGEDHLIEPEKLTEEELDEIAETFTSKEMCDRVCREVFIKNRWALHKTIEWSKSDKVYLKRAAFMIMAGLAEENRELKNSLFKVFIPILEREKSDERAEITEAIDLARDAIKARHERLRKKVEEMESPKSGDS